MRRRAQRNVIAQRIASQAIVFVIVLEKVRASPLRSFLSSLQTELFSNLLRNKNAFCPDFH
jgi:hypothetical protein